MKTWRGLVILFASCALMMTGVASAPAQATTWVTVCASPSGLNPETCLQWTGGYPGGIVRGYSPSGFYAEIKLQTCTGYPGLCSTSNWRTVADTVLNQKPGYTATYPTTRTGWFQLCTRYGNPGSWSCNGADGWVINWPRYLGD